jgi:cytochrome P450 family 142 subfamily A polypeptide 1
MQITMEAVAAYSEYMMGMITERKAEPTDDLVSVLVHAEVEGEKLEDHQIVTEVLLLLIGGDETTRHTLSGGTRQLLRHPDQHQRLINDLGLLAEEWDPRLKRQVGNFPQAFSHVPLIDTALRLTASGAYGG